MHSRHTSRAGLVVGSAVAGLLLAVLVAPANAATSTGKVKGTVYVSGQALTGAMVQLYRNHDSDPGGDGDDGVFSRVKTIDTDGKGRYSFSGLRLQKDSDRGLETYQYRVLVTDRTGKSVRTVRVVRPTKGKTVTRDVNVARAALVEGQATRADGGTPTELTVQANGSDDRPDEWTVNPTFAPNTTATVRADGSFTLKGLAPGTYQNIAFSGGPYAAQCYDFGAKALTDCGGQQSLRLRVGAGQTHTLAPVVVTKPKPPVSTVAGTVTDTSARPLKGIQVELRPVDGGSPLTSPVLTRSTGRFSYRDVPEGRYRVRLTDTRLDSQDRPTWQRQTLRRSNGKSRIITVAGGKTVRGVDARLKSATQTRSVRKGGASSAKIAFDITRLATGSKPSGRVTLWSGERSASAKVVKGRATVRLTGLPKGTASITAKYSGTRSTAGFTRTYSVKIG